MFGDPVTTAIILGLQGASVASREMGRRAVKREQRGLANAETDRQRRFGEQSRARLNETLPQFTSEAQTGARENETQRWERALAPMVGEGSFATTPVADSAPVEVKSEAARQLAKALGKGNEQLKAASRLGAYGGTQQDNSFSLGRASQDLGRIADFSRGSQDALDFEMVGAQEKADPYNMFSDVTGTLGDLYGLYAMTGGGKPKQVKRPNASKLDRHLNLRY